MLLAYRDNVRHFAIFRALCVLVRMRCMDFAHGPAVYSSDVGHRSLVPSPTPSFSSLAVRYYKRRKAGRGTGNEARPSDVRRCWVVESRTIDSAGWYLLPLVADNGVCKVYASEKDMSKVWCSSACEEGGL